MPSKLRRAISAVKDQTSIGLAKVSLRPGSSSDLEVAVLKATTHDEAPIDPSCINEVLLHAASSAASAAALVRALARRIARTRNWVVALKSLVLASRALRDGGPHFPREAFARGRRTHRLLDLSAFRDDSSRRRPWDFTAFVRTLARYLDGRLECFLAGKLHHHHHHNCHQHQNPESRIANMKPPMVLDRIGHWQRLLDLAIGTQPTGPAKHNRLIQMSFYSVVRDSFDLYRDVSDGMSMLLDNFFHLDRPACFETFRACTRAAKQFDELDLFYCLCKKIGVGRLSEYPSVQKISKDLLGTLRDFLKEPGGKLRSPPPKLTPWSPTRRESDERRQSWGWESANSDQNWTSDRQAPPASSSNSNNDGENCVLASDPVVAEEHRRGSSASSLDGWEIVLVKSARASRSSGGMNGSSSSESLWDRPSSNGQIPKNYSNPFLLDESERNFPSPPSPTPPPNLRRAMPNKEKAPPRTLRIPKPPNEKIPSSSSRGAKPDEEKNHPPSFRAVKPDVERALPQALKTDERAPAPTFRSTMPPENDPFGTLQVGDPFGPPLIHDSETKSSSLVVSSDEKARQQQLLHEQQMWVQQQSKIIAKIGLLT